MAVENIHSYIRDLSVQFDTAVAAVITPVTTNSCCVLKFNVSLKMCVQCEMSVLIIN